MIEWPLEAAVEDRNPRSIESFLHSEIVSGHISLIGELDLAAPTIYAGIGWTLLDLANYLVSKPVIQKTLTNRDTWVVWPYPATLAIWSVGHAQTATDGNALWEKDLENYTAGQKVKLAELFTDSIAKLGLETFDGELERAQRHSQLARIHAMIPDFAVKRYAEIVENGVRHDRPKQQILEEIIRDTVISKGVIRLFSARPEMGLDLITRSFNYIAYGYGLELPERLTSKISLEGRVARQKMSRRLFPEVRFFESDRKPIVLNAGGWKLFAPSGEEIEFDTFGPDLIFAEKESSGLITIFDPSDGYLIFDDQGRLVTGQLLPNEAGFLLWKSSTVLVSAIENLDPSYLIGWDEWQYSYIQNVEKLELLLDSGETRILIRSETLKFEVSRVPYLFDEFENEIMSEYPILSFVREARITDHLGNRQYALKGGERVHLDEEGGLIDITATIGLGKSAHTEGLVVPGFTIIGLENALTEGQKKKITLNLPFGWSFTYPASLRGKSSGSLELIADPLIKVEIIEFVDPHGIEHTTYLEIPILNWSLVFSDRENQSTGTETKMRLEDRKKIEALILHEVDEYLPPLKAGEISIIGKRRGRDARFDLRFLQQDNSVEGTYLTLPWNYQDLTLLSFQNFHKRKPAVLTSFHDLNNASLLEEAGLFTAQEWSDYLTIKTQESSMYRDRLRQSRGR